MGTKTFTLYENLSSTKRIGATTHAAETFIEFAQWHDIEM